VLEEDPDLATAIDPSQWQLASAVALAPGYQFERGPWRFFPSPDPRGLGALVLSGMIVIRISVGSRSHIELLGQGDVISPWVGRGQELTTPSVVTASIVENLRIALLDYRFALRTARWPEINAALIQRLIERSRRVSLQSAINAMSRIEERLEATLWQLAYRFGRVTREGTVLYLPVTHSQLGDMVAAQRPSVSTAVGRLQAQGRVIRTGRHQWLLRGEPPPMLTWLARQSGVQV
jgi:CRP-like cAMP-binding protein